MIESWLSQRAVTNADAPALRIDQQHFTFGQLSKRVDAVATRLIDRGWTDGIVAVWLPESLALVEAIWAVPQTGAVVVPLHAKMTPSEIGAILSLLDCSRLYTTAERAESLGPSISPAVEIEIASNNVDSSPSSEGRTSIDANALHSIFLTSGTTGSPKAVQLTYGNHKASAEGWSQLLDFQATYHYLCALPVTHVGGMGIMVRSALAGFPVTYLPTFDAAKVNDLMDSSGITHLSVVPTQLQRLLAVREGRPYPESLRAVILGGAPAAPTLIYDALRLNLPLVTTYGMTETASGVTAKRIEHEWDGELSAGKPLGDSTITIVDEDGSETCTGDQGTIVVSGPTVMKGYLNEIPSEGKIVTQDDGWVDASGNLHVAPNRSGVIISGGENIDPVEVEQFLLGQHGVADACVIGIADSEFGEIVVAVIVVSEGSKPDTAKIITACRDSLAPYKVPNSIDIWSEIPRTALGKLKREEVRARLIAAGSTAENI